MGNDAQRQSFLIHQARHARQCLYEARVVAVIITIAMAFVSAILYTQGYLPPESRPEQPHLILGIPSWVIWGLVVPWLVMIVVTWLFALFVMKDDEPYFDVPDEMRDRDSPAKGNVKTNR